MLDMHTKVMVGVQLRLNAILVKNKLTAGEAAYTAGAAA